MEPGYEIIFIAPQNRRHEGTRVIELVIDKAHELGIRQYTKRMDSEGQGQHGKMHSAHFFELADQPVEVVFVLDERLGGQLMDAVEATGAHVFCIRKPVEFGEFGAP
ncbi:MAG: DUF190 domain-containing protein [Marinobacter sp.]|nr:DUF190 domain-containing protein [Marinobacter sp.]